MLGYIRTGGVFNTEANMKKRMLLIFFVLSIFSGVVFAQENERAKNAFTLQFGAIGGELSYERMFNRHLSVLADVSATTMVFMDEITASAKVRWYPFGKTFYLDLGLGYTYGRGAVNMMGHMLLTVMTFGYWLTLIDPSEDYRTGGFLVQPGLGWKIDIGKQDHFLLPIGMGLDCKITGDIPDFMPFFRIGVGYAF